MPLTVYIYLFIQLLIVSYGDIKSKKIPNIWAILNILTFFIFIFILPEVYQFKLQVYIYSVVFLGVGFVLFLLKIMGAGDVKYLFSFFPLIPLSLQDTLFGYLLEATVIAGSLLLIWNTAKNWKAIWACLKIQEYNKLKEYYGKKFSYAPVILLSWVLMAVMEWSAVIY